MAHALIRRVMLGFFGVVAGILILRSGFVQAQAMRVADAFGQLRPESVTLVLVLSVVSMLISGAMWSRLLTKMGYDVPVTVGFGAYASAGMAGYVVNTAGSAVGGAVSLRRHGVCPSRGVMLTLIANVLGLCGILVWAPVGLVLMSRGSMNYALPLLGRHDLAAAVAAIVGLSIAMLVSIKLLVSAPDAGGRLARFLLRRRSQPTAGDSAPTSHSLSIGSVLGLIPWSAASWFAGALALWALLGGLSAGSGVNLGDVVGSAALAATFGSLAFFVPAGVGVRDGALIALLAHSTGLPVATCTAAAITIRALDPLTKVGLLLVVASGLDRHLADVFSRAMAFLPTFSRNSTGGPVIGTLARLSTRISSPLLEVVRVERD